ncbi:MAG: hypothetical protein NTU49_05635, partial [Gammaproteobacteria bacterium]|nr:hypothetical protein [Gammaproteobacteria bacterium]
MKACRFFAWIFALVFCPLVAFAAINPLAPTLNPTIPANTEVGYSYVATYTFTNNFPIPTPFSISVAKQVGTVFTVVNHCPSVLTVDRVCRVNITFQPAATGANLIQLTMAYLGGQTTTLPAITTTVAPLTHSITGSIHPNLPTSGTTIIGQPYSISFKYKNVDSVPVTPTALLESGNGWTDFVPTSPAPDNACSTSTPVEPTRTCVISGVFTPTSAIAYTLTSTFNYGAGGAAQSVPLTTSTTAVASSMAVTGSTTTGSAAVSAATPFTLTFTNAGNVPVTDGSLPGAPTVTGGGVITDYDDSACLHPLTVPGSCTITGNFTPNPTPTPPRDASVSIVYTYDGSSKTATSTANFTVEPVGVCNVTGTKTLALPLQTYQYGDNVVKFVFTDHCTSETVKMGTVSITSPDSSTTLITTGNDACSNFTFTGSQKTCAIYASVVPGTPGSALTVTASAPYTVNSVSQTPASASTTSTINANDPVDRMITVVNQCPFNVWMTFDGGSIIHPGTTCTGPGSTPCPTGAYCNTSANACFWSNPTVPNQDGELVAPSSNGVPSTMNITIPEDNGDDIPPIPPGTQIEVYNGGIKARLGCTGTGVGLTCAVNNCTTDSTGLCLPGSSISSPPVAFNAIELTFNKSSLPKGTTDGVYDNQIIDGINVPMEIKGRGPFDTTDANNPPYHNCPASGAIIQPVTNDVTTQFGGCTFNLVGTHPS